MIDFKVVQNKPSKQIDFINKTAYIINPYYLEIYGENLKQKLLITIRKESEKDLINSFNI